MRHKILSIALLMIVVILISGCTTIRTKDGLPYSQNSQYRYIETQESYERISYENNPQLLLPESSIYYTLIEGQKRKNGETIKEAKRTYSDYRYYVCYQDDAKDFTISLNEDMLSVFREVYPIYSYGNTIAEKDQRLLHLFNAPKVAFDNLYKRLSIYFGNATPEGIHSSALSASIGSSTFKLILNQMIVASFETPISYKYIYDLKTNSITPKLCFLTLGENWLNLNRVTISINDKIWEFPVPETLHDNSGYFTWEYAYHDIENDVLEMLKTLADSDGNNTIIRLSGNQYFRDYKSNESWVVQAKQALEYLKYFDPRLQN